MIQIDTDNPRSVKGLQLAAEASQWLKCRTAAGQKVYGVPSQTTPGRYWLATTTECNCPDYVYGNGRPCKHVAAVRVFVALVRAVQPAPTKLERRWTCGMDGCPFTSREVNAMTSHVQTTHQPAPRTAAADAAFWRRFEGE